MLVETPDAKEISYQESLLRKSDLDPVVQGKDAFVDAVCVEVLGTRYYQVAIPLLPHARANVEASLLDNASFQRGPF